MVDFSRAYPIAGSTTGAIATARAYVVIQRPPDQTEQEAKYGIAHIVAALSDNTFVTALLNKEL